MRRPPDRDLPAHPRNGEDVLSRPNLDTPRKSLISLCFALIVRIPVVVVPTGCQGQFEFLWGWNRADAPWVKT